MSQKRERHFPETGITLIEPFYSFWLTFGGRELFGVPLSAQRWEETREGQHSFTTRVQYFENVVMEVGSDNKVRLQSVGKYLWEREQNRFNEYLDSHKKYRYNLDAQLKTLP